MPEQLFNLVNFSTNSCKTREWLCNLKGSKRFSKSYIKENSLKQDNVYNGPWDILFNENYWIKDYKKH